MADRETALATTSSPVVGRTPTPAERTLRLIRERPEMRERMARNVFAARTGLHGADMVAAWNALGEGGRRPWIDVLVDAYRDLVDGADGDGQDDPDGDIGGGGLTRRPHEIVAMACGAGEPIARGSESGAPVRDELLTIASALYGETGTARGQRMRTSLRAFATGCTPPMTLADFIRLAVDDALGDEPGPVVEATMPATAASERTT